MIPGLRMIIADLVKDVHNVCHDTERVFLAALSDGNKNYTYSDVLILEAAE